MQREEDFAQAEHAPEQVPVRKPMRLAACPIIGVGASAGGLEAYEEFLSRVEAGSGLAFVLVQHLDPNHDSLMSDLLARRASIPVTQISDGAVVEPDHVYCIPPNANLSIQAGRLKLTTFSEPRGLRRPIDSFFTSLAEDQGENAACIVLSGTGSDGSQGLRAMKEAGGLTLVQEPGTARYDGMPRAASATGVVDHILPVARMPAVLVDYFGRRIDGLPASESELEQRHRTFLDSICRELRSKTGHDFSAYKPSTLLRRINRRMKVLNIAEDTSYLGRLVSDVAEADCLLRDLLINVTSFFRDAAPFKLLQNEVMPALVREKGPTDPVRIWVAGCSSGEEAYSMAMLVDDALEKRGGARPPVSIFATDIDEAMLSIARNATYSAASVKGLPEQFRDRYMLAEEQGYLVSAAIRDMVRFSSHNLIKDPPFSRLDMVSCRNLMIYLGQELQQRVVPVFHYAIREDGYLLLGTSENIGQRTDLFEPIDRRSRLFRRLGGVRPEPLDLPFEPRGRPEAALRSVAGREAELRDFKSMQARVLDRYAPAHVVVDARAQVLNASGRTAKYLAMASGAPSTSLFDLARADLRQPLRRLIDLARESGRRRVARNVEVHSEFGAQTIDLVVDPVADGRFLVVFQDVEEFRHDEEIEEVEADLSEDARLHELQGELRHTQERLRSTIEELEISNEELKTSNEEMMSMNEELQSANEELSTVNEELKNKLDQLARTNSDMQNFLASTQIAVIFLDRNLRLRTFTPASTRLFNFIDQDKGRPLSDVSTRLDYDELPIDAGRVLSSLVPIEREVSAKGGQSSYVARIMPYRTLDDVIDGIVITLTDVTRLKKAEADLMLSEQRAHEQKEEIETLYRTTPIGMALVDTDHRYLRVNQALADMNGRQIEEHAGRTVEEMSGLHGALIKPLVDQVLSAGEILRQTEISLPNRSGDGRAFYLVDVYPYGEPKTGRSGVGLIVQDVTDARLLAESQRQLMDELQHRVKNTLATVQSVVRQTARGKRDVDAFADALNRRIAALARTHNLLTVSNWIDASLRRILDQELSPYYNAEGTRIRFSGPDLALPPRMALALTMAFHELTTNAAKHGALSTPTGRLEISWELIAGTDVQNLRMSWSEFGGPPIQKEGRRGFGRLLLEKGLAHDLQGSVSLDFRPEGLLCRIEVPFRLASGS